MQKVISKDDTTLITDRALLAARLAFAGAAASLFFVAVLHVLSPEFDPSWRMVSEYALGNYGWVLSLMFLTQALGCVALFFTIQPQVHTAGGRIGLFFLLAAALGLSMASVFDFRHSLHGLASMIGVPSLPIAAMILSVSLSRRPAWSPARRLLLWTANLTWLSLAWMLAALFTGLSRSGGQFGPDVLIGWPNRILIAAYCGWIMTVAWQSARLSR